jgi:hypothetical protein
LGEKKVNEWSDQLQISDLFIDHIYFVINCILILLKNCIYFVMFFLIDFVKNFIFILLLIFRYIYFVINLFILS